MSGCDEIVYGGGVTTEIRTSTCSSCRDDSSQDIFVHQVRLTVVVLYS